MGGAEKERAGNTHGGEQAQAESIYLGGDICGDGNFGHRNSPGETLGRMSDG